VQQDDPDPNVESFDEDLHELEEQLLDAKDHAGSA